MRGCGVLPHPRALPALYAGGWNTETGLYEFNIGPGRKGENLSIPVNGTPAFAMRLSVDGTHSASFLVPNPFKCGIIFQTYKGGGSGKRAFVGAGIGRDSRTRDESSSRFFRTALKVKEKK